MAHEPSKELPFDTGYYWCKGFSGFETPIVLFLDCSNQDAGGRFVLNVGDSNRIHEGDKRLEGTLWYPCLEPAFP